MANFLARLRLCISNGGGLSGATFRSVTSVFPQRTILPKRGLWDGGIGYHISTVFIPNTLAVFGADSLSDFVSFIIAKVIGTGEVTLRTSVCEGSNTAIFFAIWVSNFFSNFRICAEEVINFWGTTTIGSFRDKLAVEISVRAIGFARNSDHSGRGVRISVGCTQIFSREKDF